jgi:hypothetical protein
VGSDEMTKQRPEKMTFEKRIDYFYTELKHMLMKKHKNYGEENLKKHKMHGVMVRIDDKCARLNHLINNIPDKGSDPNDTTMLENHNDIVRDQFMDVAGYCFQALRLMAEAEELTDCPCFNCREGPRYPPTRFCSNCIRRNDSLKHVREFLGWINEIPHECTICKHLMKESIGDIVGWGCGKDIGPYTDHTGCYEPDKGGENEKV